jgi:hypothetical protein
MNAIKLCSAIFLIILSTYVNAVIIEGNFTGRIAFEQSDEGVWSKDLWGSEMTGKFWFDTNFGPVPESGSPHNLDLNNYESATNSWINFILFIDGKTIDISTAVALTSDFDPKAESLLIDTKDNSFRIYKNVTTSDSQGEMLTTGIGFWFDPADDYNELFFSMNRIANGEQQYISYMEMSIPNNSISVRSLSVPEPSSFSLIFLGLLALVYRRHVQFYTR